jgi:hypothetical protein
VRNSPVLVDTASPVEASDSSPPVLEERTQASAGSAASDRTGVARVITRGRKEPVSEVPTSIRRATQPVPAALAGEARPTRREGTADRIDTDRPGTSDPTAVDLDRLTGELDRLRGELDGLTGELDRLTEEFDPLTEELDRLTEEAG